MRHKVCKYCNSTLDPEERCDCIDKIKSQIKPERIAAPNKLLESKTFLVGCDISNQPHENVIMISEMVDGKPTVTKIYCGKEAEELYQYFIE